MATGDWAAIPKEEERMSSAEEAARKRREKILARGQDRMKFVSGEVKALDENSVASPAIVETTLPATPKPVLPDSTPETSAEAPSTPTDAQDVSETVKSEVESVPAVTPVDTRPRWERKWEKDVSTVKETREISQTTLESLKKTEELAVETPRAEKTLAARSTPVENPKVSYLPKLKVDSLLTSIIVICLGVMSGSTQGQFIQDNLWFPMGSFLLFALLIRVLLSVSFSRLGLVSTKKDESVSSGGLIDMALRFLPPPVKNVVSNFRMVSDYVKDSYDDMMLFIFAHGVSSRLALVKA